MSLVRSNIFFQIFNLKMVDSTGSSFASLNSHDSSTSSDDVSFEEVPSKVQFKIKLMSRGGDQVKEKFMYTVNEGKKLPHQFGLKSKEMKGKLSS